MTVVTATAPLNYVPESNQLASTLRYHLLTEGPSVVDFSSEITYLNELCDLYGSDKGSNGGPHAYEWAAHTYTEVYARLFAPLKDSALTLFECGIGTNNPAVPSNMGAAGRPGASLRVWRDYFPKAMIYGADVDPGALFEEDRIKTGQLDQTNPETVSAFWENFGNFTPNIVIDDGLHTYSAAIALHSAVWPRLAKGGLYIIEDVKTSELALFHKWLQTCEGKAEVVSLIRPGLDLRDNTLVVLRKV